MEEKIEEEKKDWFWLKIALLILANIIAWFCIDKMEKVVDFFQNMF